MRRAKSSLTNKERAEIRATRRVRNRIIYQAKLQPGYPTKINVKALAEKVSVEEKVVDSVLTEYFARTEREAHVTKALAVAEHIFSGDVQTKSIAEIAYDLPITGIMPLDEILRVMVGLRQRVFSGPGGRVEDLEVAKVYVDAATRALPYMHARLAPAEDEGRMPLDRLLQRLSRQQLAAWAANIRTVIDSRETIDGDVVVPADLMEDGENR